MPKIHHTMGVYNSPGVPYKHNGVLPEHLADHIEYNKVMRFGRALFVDGKCVHRGYLSEERCAAIEKELAEKPVVMDRCTMPYH